MSFHFRSSGPLRFHLFHLSVLFGLPENFSHMQGVPVSKRFEQSINFEACN